MDQAYTKVIYDGHELEVPTRLAQQNTSNDSRVMKFLLNPNDWLAQHQYFCIVGIALCLCVVCAL